MKKLFILFLVSIFGVAAAADGYICIADKSTGFVNEDGEWQSVDFDVDEKRYLVRRATDDDSQSTSPWVYGEFGQTALTGQSALSRD